LLSGDTATALGWLEKAATSARSSSDPRTLAQALNNLGQTLTAAGRPAEGEARLREALAIYSSAGDRKGAASALHHVGLARAGLGDFKGASSLLRQALRDRSDAGVRDDAADSLFGLARVARLQGRLSESARYCEQALDIVESLRGGVPGEHFRITWRAARDNFFEFYVDLLMEMHFARPAAGFDRRALEIAEYASGRSMLELLREGRSDIRGGVDPILLAREQDARSLTGYLAGRLSRLEERTHSPESRKLLETRYRDSMERGRAIEDEIRERSPAYSALIWPKPAHARDIRQGIGPGTVLLEYSVGEKASYLWQIDTESIRAIRLPGRSQLDPLCREVRQLSGDARGRRLHPETQGRYHDALTALSKTLLAPAAPQIANRKVLIVSRGMLQDVPFAALPLPGNPDEAPLGVTNEIVRMTSASAWLELRRENRPADSGRGIAVFADPVFDGEDPRVSRVLRTSAAESSEFARLPFSRKEGEEILGIFPGSSRLAALDFEASRSNLFRPETGSFRFLHFATHSVAGSSPELTGIALSNLTRDGRSVDGFVRLPDIYNLPRLSCRLVVLDGCDSGGGADARGEGLIGLMRGFLYAGSGSVLINLWPVEDGPRTADLMRDFYSAMERGGATPSAALRTARLNRWKLRDRWSDEYYLAGLEVYGADR
jgi:CHAT domain-containing protein